MKNTRGDSPSNENQATTFDLGGNRTHDIVLDLPTELRGRTEKVGDDLTVVNRGEEKARVHMNVIVPDFLSPTSWLSRQSNGRSNPEVLGSIPTVVKIIFSLPRVVLWFPSLGLAPSGSFMGFTWHFNLHFRVNSLFHPSCNISLFYLFFLSSKTSNLCGIIKKKATRKWPLER